MNLTSLLPIAAAAFAPWAAAATQMAKATPFASWLGSSNPQQSERGEEPAATGPDFPLSSSDRDRLERLLADDLDLLASLLRRDPQLALSAESKLDLMVDASGAVRASTTTDGGESSEVDLDTSDELHSVLRRIGATLQRLAPPESHAAGWPQPAPSKWQIRVDPAGARLH